MKKFLLLGIVLIIIFALYFFLANVNSGSGLSEKDKNSALLNLLGRQARTQSSPQKDKEYTSKYVSLIYPGEGQIYAYRPVGFEKDKATLDYFSFDIKSPRLIFNFSVATTFITKLNDFPSVRFREDNNPLYTKDNIVLDKKEGVVFEREGREAEESAFFLINDKIYSITVTGTSFEEIDKLFEKVSKTIKFL